MKTVLQNLRGSSLSRRIAPLKRSYWHFPIVLLASLTFTTAAAFGQSAPRTQVSEVSPANYDRLHVGDSDGRRIVVPTNQVLSPLGRQVIFSARPTAVAIGPQGRWLAVMCHDRVSVIDLDTSVVVGSAPHRGSYTGIIWTPNGTKILASNIQGTIDEYAVAVDGELKRDREIKLLPPGNAAVESVPRVSKGAPPTYKNPLPAGLALDPAGKTFWVVLNMRNTVAEVDFASGRELREISVGNAPYDVVPVAGKLYVTNWAGRRPKPGDVTGPSGSGTPVLVDSRRYIASDGSVSVIDPAVGREIRQIGVGLHPCGMAASPDGRCICVANAHSDTVSVIDTQRDTVVQTFSTRPTEKLLFGGTPNALTFSQDGRTLYVSNGTNNAVAVVRFTPPECHLAGCLPVGWYPAGLALDEKRQMLYVANLNGLGPRGPESAPERNVKGRKVRGFNSLDLSGTISMVPLSEAGRLSQHTQEVLANNRLTEGMNALALPRKDAPPRPVPQRHGEPSVFKHVLYIIKEIRTYDQVFGDLPQGKGDPQLCIFGRDVTPNHHKLAEEFVLLDNFYCSGVLSATGHQWTDEAYVTDYLEKSFGGWVRSYPYDGNDAMAYAPTGFLWDNALAHGRTLRVYGEFVKATVRWKDPHRKGQVTFLDCYQDFLRGTGAIEVRAKAAIKTLEPYICPTAIGFPTTVPDIHRAEQFIRELRDYERRGMLPNLMVLALPCNHTSGTLPGRPSPEAMVADNDLALGRIVEAVSRSKFWPETCILVVEDDPQNGFDHVDGHRTVALVLSPYTRRKGVDSTNYNQTSMVRTIEIMLGLPPMNQFDASATPMASCFGDVADLAPYQPVPANIPLDRLNPRISEIQDPGQRHWAEVSLRLPLDEADEADEDTLNRILWHARRGRDDTYPAWAVSAEREDEDQAR